MTAYLCPKCKGDHLEVNITTWARLIQDDPENLQTLTDEASDRSHDWNEHSFMKCWDCDTFGTVREFTLPHAKPAAVVDEIEW